MPASSLPAPRPPLAGPAPGVGASPPALTAAYCLSVVAAPLAALAAAAGLAMPGLYRDPAVLVPQARGQDLVTLVVGVPLLLGALVAARRGSARAHLLWLGALGYLAYTYTSYAFGARFNPLFLVYVALMGLAIYGLVLGLAATDAPALAARFSRGAPIRLVGAFLLAVAALMACVWLADIVPTTLGGGVPQAVREAETPTSVIHVLDLALVLPALAIAGGLLLRRAPWGYVLAGVLLVKAATLGLAILAMGLFIYLAEQTVTPGLTGFFAALTLGASGLTVVYLRAIGPPAEPLAAAPQRRAA
jgi:hypothetical protein